MLEEVCVRLLEWGLFIYGVVDAVGAEDLVLHVSIFVTASPQFADWECEIVVLVDAHDADEKGQTAALVVAGHGGEGNALR